MDSLEQRIRQPTELRPSAVYEESESELEVESEPEPAQGTQQRRRRKAQERGKILVPCRCKTYSNGQNPHFVTQRVRQSHKRRDKWMESNKAQSITEEIEVSDFENETNENIDLTMDMDLAIDMGWMNDNDSEISGVRLPSECSNADSMATDNCLDHHMEFPELYNLSSGDEYDFSSNDENCCEWYDT
jgi:hypothetical protein